MPTFSKLLQVHESKHFFRLLYLAMINGADVDLMKLAGYKSFSDIPNYRRHKGFWTIWIILPIVAVLILLTGDVFYKKKDEVLIFSEANAIFAMILGGIWFGSQTIAIIEFFKVTG